MMLSTMMVFMAMPIRNSIMTLSTDDNNFRCCDSDGAEDDHDKETRRTTTSMLMMLVHKRVRQREREGEIKQTERGKNIEQTATGGRKATMIIQPVLPFCPLSSPHVACG